MKTLEYQVNVKYRTNGHKWAEEWLLNGKWHRLDGPAFQYWLDNGQKWAEDWLLNGKLHRLDGPAIQSWHSNGQKCSESWYLNGKCHRLDGPAIQSWNDNGQISQEYWYINDIKLTEQEFKIQSDPDYQKYLELKSKFENK